MCPANDSHDSSFVQIKKLGWRSRESPTMQTFYKNLHSAISIMIESNIQSSGFPKGVENMGGGSSKFDGGRGG